MTKRAATGAVAVTARCGWSAGLLTEKAATGAGHTHHFVISRHVSAPHRLQNTAPMLLDTPPVKPTKVFGYASKYRLPPQNYRLENLRLIFSKRHLCTNSYQQPQTGFK
jgi:hypothetical protein